MIPIPSNNEVSQIKKLTIIAIQSCRKSKSLIEKAKFNVESLIDGTLDIDALLAEGSEIEEWLVANSSS
jgi:hypothetical protein